MSHMCICTFYHVISHEPALKLKLKLDYFFGGRHNAVNIFNYFLNNPLLYSVFSGGGGEAGGERQGYSCESPGLNF